MALVDVSSLMVDPMFTDSFMITSQTVVINQYGEQVSTPTTMSAIGVIQAVSKDILSRFPEASILTTDIVVHYKGILNIQKMSGYCDIITFKGVEYLVKDLVENYLNWGAGWTSAICQRRMASA
jgi:hypothetical protein